VEQVKQEQEQTWATRASKVQGVNPLGLQQENQQKQQGLGVLQKILQTKKNAPVRAEKIFGNARETTEDGSENVKLAADVDLVAFGVRKDVSAQMMTEWLQSKKIDAVVKIMTRTEVLESVRTITMRVTVKASQHEEALKPEVWPYRVGVRHWDNRTVRRERQERQELGKDSGQGQGAVGGDKAGVGEVGAGARQQQAEGWQKQRRSRGYGGHRGGGGQITNQNIFDLLSLITNQN
jgi:hypothetical protein